MTADRRAALVEKVARLLCDWDGYDTDEMQTMSDGTTYVMWQSYSNKATAAVSLIRAEVLEEAARVIENNCHDDMTRAEEAAAIRALKEAS
jgi:hypothetical protein